MVTAVETLPGCDPDRAGFTVALEAARDTVVSLVGTTATSGPSSPSDLVGHIGTRVLHALLPGRRMRLSARIVKCRTSRYNIWNRDGRPRASTPITAIEITVHPPALPSTQDPSRALSGRWARSASSWPRTPTRPCTPGTSHGISGSPPRGAPSAASPRNSATGPATTDSSAPRQAPTRSPSLKPWHRQQGLNFVALVQHLTVAVAFRLPASALEPGRHRQQRPHGRPLRVRHVRRIPAHPIEVIGRVAVHVREAIARNGRRVEVSGRGRVQQRQQGLRDPLGMGSHPEPPGGPAFMRVRPEDHPTRNPVRTTRSKIG